MTILPFCPFCKKEMISNNDIINGFLCFNCPKSAIIDLEYTRLSFMIHEYEVFCYPMNYYISVYCGTGDHFYIYSYYINFEDLQELLKTIKNYHILT